MLVSYLFLILASFFLIMHAQADSEKKNPTKFSELYLTHAQYDRASSSHAFDNAQVQSIHRPLYLSLASCPGPGFAHQPQEKMEVKKYIAITFFSQRQKQVAWNV